MSEGYDKFATFMAGKDYPIFRKFKSAAFRDLLYRQAELAALEAEYADISLRNKNMKGDERLYDGNWELLSNSGCSSGDGEQWEKALEIRRKLGEYCADLPTPRSPLKTNYHQTIVSPSTATLLASLNPASATSQ